MLMHGYPDNHHLYDRLVPHLPGRHVVVFDFLGWGESDKPADHDYTFDNQTGDLDAVVTGLALDRVVLVPHDASGPPAINWALDHPDQVAAIVALNTFYCDIAGSPLNPPEAIRLFSDPNFARLSAHFAESPEQFRWLYDFQVGGFIQDDQVRHSSSPSCSASSRTSRARSARSCGSTPTSSRRSWPPANDETNCPASPARARRLRRRRPLPLPGVWRQRLPPCSHTARRPPSLTPATSPNSTHQPPSPIPSSTLSQLQPGRRSERRTDPGP